MWDCEALDVLTAKVGALESPIKRLGKLTIARAVVTTALGNLQRGERASRNAAHHYNIGNELYEPMLGETMAYTCAYWERPDQPLAAGATDLDSAQKAKYELICQKLGLKPGMRLLDIGCGWGGLLKHAVEFYDIEAVGITPAEEQVAYIKNMGLPIDARQLKYTELEDESFDRIVSVGMFEHVGPKNYRGYFEKARTLLKPDGLNMVHTIGAPKRRYFMDPWTNKYIFPGGHIPSGGQIVQASSKEGFVIGDIHEMGTNYDPTLMAWNARFQAAWPELKEFKNEDGTPKYNEQFRRMWEYYLKTCAGSFRNGTNLLLQVVMGSQEAITGYEPVR